MGKRELVALLNLSSWCLVMVEWLFLAVPWGCLRFGNVEFPDHTHLLFIISKFQIEFNSLMRQVLSEPDFYGDLVYILKKIVGSNNFSAQFIKIISHYKKIGYDINVLQQTACLLVNPITIGNFAPLFNCTLVVRTPDSMAVLTNRLIYWWDGRGLMLWLLSGPPEFTCWISFATVFSLIYCWVLIFALSPFYILIYLF